ncbi:helix-turn-helix domain-containing protein [Faecalimonas sp.]
MTMNEIVGSNIKKYRIANNCTLKEIAAIVHKSCSTISKYEKGIIPLTADTIAEFAQIFEIPPSQLLAVPSEKIHSIEKTDFLKRQYVYSYDGKQKKILKSILEEFQTTNDTNTFAQLFYNMKDFKNPEKCKVIYSGKGVSFGPWQHYHLKNHSHSAEEIWLCAMETFSNNNKVGILAGISSVTMYPCARKILIAPDIQKENEILNELIFSKEDLQLFKKYNFFSIRQFLPEE